VAAISVGLLAGEVLLDLCYEEDMKAEADFNIVMTDQGEFVEVQGAAEGGPYSRPMFNAVLDTAARGLSELLEVQRRVIETL